MLKIISVTFGHTTELEISVGCFLLQTNPNWELHVVHDGPAPELVKKIMNRYRDDNRIHFTCSVNRNGKYGHPNRRTELEQLKGSDNDFVLITNSDNYYVTEFVEQMLSASEMGNIGIVMCDTLHSHLHYGYHSSQLYEGGVDMGAFIVRFDIAKKVGFNHTHFSADGAYAVECGEECVKQGLRVAYIPKALFIHN